MNLVKIKLILQKTQIGSSVLWLYRFLVSYPMLWVKALAFLFIENKLIKPSFYKDEKLFQLLREDKKSFSRFGDGEISWIFRDANGYFGQNNSSELSSRLLEVVNSSVDDLIIGVPSFFDDMYQYNFKRKISRNAHLLSNHKRWKSVISVGQCYGDSLITRVYNGRNNIDYVEVLFKEWCSVWRNRNVVIVEGEHTKFGVGNDLLTDAKTVRRIVGPAENAFSKLNELHDLARIFYEDDVLFLICLGPTATILSYDIAVDGHQAIDIGHLDIEYEWYLNNRDGKCSVTGKYVNEAGGAPRTVLSDKVLNCYRKEIEFTCSYDDK